MNYFEVFDPTKVPGERKLRATFSNDKVAALTDHFSNLLLELKIYLLNHQVMKPLDIYANLFSSRPDSLKHIFVLVELILSPSTAKCARWFSAMDRIKTNFKTRIEKRREPCQICWGSKEWTLKWKTLFQFQNKKVEALFTLSCIRACIWLYIQGQQDLRFRKVKPEPHLSIGQVEFKIFFLPWPRNEICKNLLWNLIRRIIDW